MPHPMEVLLTESWHEALELKAAHPEAVPIAGGTDLMVELNFDRIRPPAILDLTRIPELTAWGSENPISLSVASVCGSSSTPVNTRLPNRDDNGSSPAKSWP